MSDHTPRPWMILLVVTVLSTLIAPVGAAAPDPSADTPWWRQRKIRFMWGQWGHQTTNPDDQWGLQRPREHFRDVAQSGGTVYAETRGRYSPDNARHAHEFGMKYFAYFECAMIPDMAGGRRAVTASGELSDPKKPYCPLDQSVYEQWMIEPYLQGIRDGLIDGLHADWEPYGERGEPEICYCDDCFARFMTRQNIKGNMPEPAQRVGWLQGRQAEQAYEAVFSERRIEMFSAIRQALHAVKPDLLFSAYGLNYGGAVDFARGVHTPQAPFIHIDSKFYTDHDQQPWWESESRRWRQEGYLYIPGGWTQALFGAQVSQVSAARWMYEAAVNEDGYWLWFERQLDDELLRAFATADRDIQAVERSVGAFILRGERDSHFATVVEWTGRPELEQAVVHDSYHLQDAHLTHLNNTNTEWPLRVRVCFARLTGEGPWIVRDPIVGSDYSRDGVSRTWTGAELEAGVVITLDARRDAFLLIQPAAEAADDDASALMYTREFDTMPPHAAAAAKAGETTPPAPSGFEADVDLLYTATQPMGYRGPEGPSTLANAIHRIHGSEQNRLRQVWGHLWSPRYSPDGSRIAFVHNAGGRGQIFVMNADGSGAVNISRNDFCDRSPVWSPDSRRLAFTSTRTGDWEIWVMNADGSDPRQLTDHPGLDRAPNWSPDGLSIAWESHVSGLANIWLADVATGQSRPLISPDKPLKMEEVSGPGQRKKLPSMFDDNTLYLRNPIWSPSGRHLAATMMGGTIVVLKADGSSLLQLRYLPYAEDLCWSPDGRRIAAAWRNAPYCTNRSGIVVMNADGSGDSDKDSQGRFLLGRNLVDVASQGPRLTDITYIGSVHTWYAHGSGEPRVVLKTFTSLAWSPDGKKLAFSSDLDPSGAFYVHIIPLHGGEPSRLDATRSAWPQTVAWMPPQPSAQSGP